jgi:hypothetical protein
MMVLVRLSIYITLIVCSIIDPLVLWVLVGVTLIDLACNIERLP